MKNEPYVKRFNRLGEILNPIAGAYISHFRNRRERRSRTPRFRGNNKGISLTVLPTAKYYRETQVLFCRKKNTVKTIHHYRLA